MANILIDECNMGDLWLFLNFLLDIKELTVYVKKFWIYRKAVDLAGLLDACLDIRMIDVNIKYDVIFEGPNANCWAKDIVQYTRNNLNGTIMPWNENNRKRNKVCYSTGIRSLKDKKPVKCIEHLGSLLGDFYDEVVCIDLPMPIRKAAKHISECDLLVTNDNLWGHIGKSIGCPVVILTGPLNIATSSKWQNGSSIISNIPDLRKYLTKIKRKKVYFSHLIEPANVGDFHASPKPYFYFDGSQHTNLKNIQYIQSIKSSVVIMGGGGLLDHSLHWNDLYKTLKENNNFLVGWAIGTNRHYDGKSFKTDYSLFDILSVRDYNTDFIHVPCPSCMSNHFNMREIGPTLEVGYIEHCSFTLNDYDHENYISCNTNKMKDIIDFISRYRKIVTNSYHALYWTQLMNREVELVQPFSTKFDKLEYRGKLPDDYLERCRLKNSNFYEYLKSEIMRL